MITKIRPFKTEDYKDVCLLLIEQGVNPPAELSDMGGICLVSEDKGEITGCIWALVGNSTQAYVGYFATKNVHTGYKLMEHLETILRFNGVKRFRFVTNKSNKSFLPIAQKLGNHFEAISVWREL